MDWKQRWWLRELEGLIDAGVIDAAASGRVLAHYERRAASRPAVPLFAVLGASLIGLGSILLLAHNWAAFSEATRAALSAGAVVVGQAAAGFALWRRAESTAWTEAACLFASFGFAAGLALLQQTYQVPGDLGPFLSTWAWLTLPVAYALDSRAGISLVLGIAASTIPLHWGSDASPWGFWALVAATLPYLVRLARRTSISVRDPLVAWVGVPVLLVGCIFQAPLFHWVWVVLLALGVSAALYGAGQRGSDAPHPAAFAAPAAGWLGAAALAGALFLLGFSGVWDGLDEAVGERGAWRHAVPAVLVGGAALAVLAWGARRQIVARDGARLLWLGTPLAFLVSFFAGALLGDETAAAWIMALYALAVGSGTVLAGVSEGALARANGGMLLVGAVIAQRFLDSEWSFTVRGLVFIGLGVAFLALNLKLRKRSSVGTSPAVVEGEVR